MSKIVAAQMALPSQYPNFAPDFRPALPAGYPPLSKAHYFPAADEALVALADPRAYKVLTRAGMLIQLLGQSLASQLTKSNYKVGIYCALEARAVHFPTIERLKNGMDSSALQASLPPKQCLSSMPHIAASQLAITLGLRGPITAFPHSVHGGAQALSQAEFDLTQGVVAEALVLAAFTLDDPLSFARYDSSLIPSEGAAGIVLTKGQGSSPAATTHPRLDFGLAGPIISLTHHYLRVPYV